jgi:hypothetical protein
MGFFAEAGMGIFSRNVGWIGNAILIIDLQARLPALQFNDK